MGGLKKEQKPNYELLFRSAVSALTSTYDEYKKACIKELQCSWFDANGSFVVLSGRDERLKRIGELSEELLRLQKDVMEYRKLMESKP